MDATQWQAKKVYGGNMDAANQQSMDSYRINDRAWKLVLSRLNELLADGRNQSDIARLLGVDRATVGRWIENRKGGEKTPFRSMLHYIDKLRIPLPDVFLENPDHLPPPGPNSLSSAFDVRVAATLAEMGRVLGKDAKALAASVPGASREDLAELLAGRTPMRVSDFHHICRALGVSADVILKRAAELAESEEGGNDTARRSA